ncbi:ankyrin repeat domain-containing protein [Chryseobacterium pennipullorum]|uniref:Ankyrin repeat domain-containing protein n=1 Tax=Chryseobacterium pennipullorum TaxID=2258963 RepID=A0A3D9B0K0_9FLAO|nr:ankyrin repeat domain-containing protein [Chryseobacterium pennipullorum]
MFEGAQLQAAQNIFDENNTELINIMKANPEVINQLSKKENKGYTLLHYAALLENMKAMESLLENGADPNIITPQGLPVRHAVALNNYDMLNLLLKYRATLNPSIGTNPISDAMMLGDENMERKMIDYLMKNGADINHISYNGGNIMEDATRDNLDLAAYFLEKGGQPLIAGTNICPMADYIQYKETQKKERNLPESPYYEKLFGIKKQLIEKYNVQFPYKKDLIEEAKLRIKLYENLSPKDKISINFDNNYGENLYREDLNRVKGN